VWSTSRSNEIAAGDREIPVTPEEAFEYVQIHGVVLESAKGPIPNLADAVAGEPIRGSYWGHARGDEIFGLTRAIRASKEILVCRLVQGKITYIHRRLWPALVRLQKRVAPDRLAALREIHSSTGKHELQVTPFPDWVPAGVSEQAKRLTVADAVSQFGEWFQSQRAAMDRRSIGR
jgi:hypothetical protein